MDLAEIIKTEFEEAEACLLQELREARRCLRPQDSQTKPSGGLTIGQKIADSVASTMGSWRFIIIQSTILMLWIFLNITAYIQKWDPYPFILLNLALSFQAAYAAPFIMMAQNRQQDIDRKEASSDHQINLKAELEIEFLHRKIDQLREKEIVYLTEAVRDLVKIVEAKNPTVGPSPQDNLMIKARPDDTAEK